ncbi:MAG: AAA family ATPase, partial [Pseudomonadota bacterium]
HAHCVWSRIDAATMRAIKLSHYKRKLGDVSRALYRRHDWDMPEGFRDPAKRSPDNYSREEAGQAKREERDPKGLKATFRRCWEASDSRDAFAAALKAEGYLLARGDRRGFVAVDADGKIWSLSRWCGVKPRELRARLGDEERLPSVEDALSRTIELPPPKKEPIDPLVEQRRRKLVERQREERVDLLKAQEARRLDDLRAARPSALRVAFLRMTGRYDRFVAAREKAADAARARDRAERQAVVDRHLAERRAFDRELRRSGLSAAFARQSASDAGHSYVAPREDLPLSQAQLGQDPSLILDHISKTEARFDRTDVLRALARRIDDPFMLRDAADRAMKSAKLVRLDDGPSPRFTTRDYQTAEAALRAATSEMSRRGGFGLAREHIAAATAQQDAEMRRAFGGRLSDEQRAAVSHILSDRRLACVVGLAGAGKSTMLATAMDAWRRQGVTVHGAALAGKAAEGLETASSIQSRTLASLETSWENGYEPIAEGDVLVVDEAGMIGTRQLERIARKMKEIGAKLVLVGDPDQLQPIEAGTPFRD